MGCLIDRTSEDLTTPQATAPTRHRHRLMLPVSPAALYADSVPIPAERSPDRHRPIVICPLRFEQRALRRAGLGRSCDLKLSGAGAQAIASWIASLEPADRPVILAGLAGALRPDRLAGSACIITEVRLEKGGPLLPSWPDPRKNRTSDGSPDSCIVTSSTAIVRRAADKAILAGRTGADMVDLESVAFATAASTRGWRWGIVRGISDAAETDLPAEIEACLDDRGRLRRGALLAALCRRPALASSLTRLRRDGLMAMQAVAERIGTCLG